MDLDLVTLYCSIDDFWNSFKVEWKKKLIENKRAYRGPSSKLTIPEMMTVVVLFHASGYRIFKDFYKKHALKQLKEYFPDLISYSRFVDKMKMLFVPLFAYMHSMKGKSTGIAFIDSTRIAVCNSKRISRNKVFKGIAKKGKTSMGWFYGFKLHLIINDRGEILSFLLTPGNVSDVSVADPLSQGIEGKLFGDKGYISFTLFKKLLERNLQLFTNVRSNMKVKLLHLQDKLLLRKRSLIETINDQLKNICEIEHTRHRSIINFGVNLLAGLIAYSHQEKKPSLKLGNDVLNYQAA